MELRREHQTKRSHESDVSTDRPPGSQPVWSNLPIGCLKKLLGKFVTPGATGDDIGQRYFNVSMTERRLVVRRMVRCGLATALPADACPPAVIRRSVCSNEGFNARPTDL